MNRKIMILIPTYNNVDDVDTTMDSIRKQDYPQEDIYTCIVDFGSTDGTYEKILQYDSEHLGVFQLGKKQQGSTSIKEAAELMYYQSPGGKYAYKLLLQPGDLIYSNCLSKCVEICMKYSFDCSGCLLLNADVKLLNGEVIKQMPLSLEECNQSDIMMHENSIKEKAYHYSAWFGKEFALANHRNSKMENERCFFYKSQIIALELPMIYIPEVLICLKERIYDNEFEEILLRWESIIRLDLTYSSKFKTKIDSAYIEKALLSLAYYCLWRSCKRYHDLDQEQLENCVYIAELISPEITDTPEYKDIFQLVVKKESSLYNKCCDYFIDRV